VSAPPVDGSSGVLYEDGDSIFVTDELARVLRYAHEAILADSRLTFGQALDIGKRTADVHVRPEDEASLLTALFKLSTRGFPSKVDA
jgi:hypothetical protein